MNRSKPIRPAFVSTFAVAASATLLLAAGCDTTVQFAGGGGGDGGDAGGGGTVVTCDFGDPGCDDACPQSPPSDGSSCRQNEQNCYWDDCDLGTSHSATCDLGSWDVSEGVIGCNPPPPDPVCPPELPQNGSACEVGWNGPYTCTGYGQDECGVDLDATCSEQGTWGVQGGLCNPPPPDWCQTATSSEECGTQAGCEWLVPGCGDPALPAAGCFADYGCVPGSCSLNETCEKVITDPCWNSTCDACAQESSVCLPTG